jgi:hypothetical protein
VSSLVTVAHADRVSLEQLQTTRGVHGAFVRARLIKPLVLLAEADLLHTSRRAPGYTDFLQLDYEPIRGLHVFGTVEMLDGGRHHAPAVGFAPEQWAGEGKPRAGGWLSADWLFWQQLDLRVDMIARQDSGAYVFAQLHAYL